MLGPLLFLQYNLHWHWFLCACIFSSVSEIPLDHKILKNIQTHLFMHFLMEHMVYHSTWQDHLAVILHSPDIERPGPN
jgi:hypothetical protein